MAYEMEVILRDREVSSGSGFVSPDGYLEWDGSFVIFEDKDGVRVFIPEDDIAAVKCTPVPDYDSDTDPECCEDDSDDSYNNDSNAD